MVSRTIVLNIYHQTPTNDRYVQNKHCTNDISPLSVLCLNLRTTMMRPGADTGHR